LAKEGSEAGEDLLRVLEPDAVLKELQQKLSGTQILESKAGIGEYNLKPLTTFEGVRGYEEVERYWVKDPFSFVVILFTEKANEYLYHVVEPALTAFERALLEKIYDDLRDILILEEIPTEAKKSEILKQKTKELVNGYKIPLSPSSLDKILYYTERNYIGYGFVDPLLKDQSIEDISCDGVDVPVFLYHRKYQNIKTNIVMGEDELDLFVTTLAQRCGKHLSAGRPMVSATMPDGSRLQATLGREISARGSSFSIRKFSENPFTPVELIRFGTFSVDMLVYLWMAIENLFKCGVSIYPAHIKDYNDRRYQGVDFIP
jgi:flagellar protein FlaI